MSSHPDPHPDSPPTGAPDHTEQVESGQETEREDVENIEDSAGTFQGTAGTGGENRVQDQSFER
jgi:hypothetical protein